MSAYGEQLAVLSRQDGIQKELEDCGEDMERMSQLLDELQAGFLPPGRSGPGGLAGLSVCTVPSRWSGQVGASCKNVDLHACPTPHQGDIGCHTGTHCVGPLLAALTYACRVTCKCWLQELSGRAAELDTKLLDKKIDQMMPELGFAPDDNDRLVASYRCTCSDCHFPAGHLHCL